MKKYSVSEIKSIINSFEEKGLKYIDVLGTKTGAISEGVTRYTAHDPNIKQFIVFEMKNSKKEISFLFDNCILNYTDVKNAFGLFEVNYNFRENYSEFKINLSSNNVVDIYFIKDNRYEMVEENIFIESDPKGRKTEHSILTFEGFCLRVVQ
jgi:delta-aminolevulinic acid dehydratase/porphobilinogen synthase